MFRLNICSSKIYIQVILCLDVQILCLLIQVKFIFDETVIIKMWSKECRTQSLVWHPDGDSFFLTIWKFLVSISEEFGNDGSSWDNAFSNLEVASSTNVWVFTFTFLEIVEKFYTTWKVSVFGVILVCIFPHSEWIRRDTPYFSVFGPNVGKYGPE